MTQRTCLLPECDGPRYGWGYCSKHYQRVRANGTTETPLARDASPADRFERYVDRDAAHSGCWLWTGGRTDRGYGRFKLSGKSVRAHRFSYELHVGPIPDGLRALHRCDNPPCVNPAHLFLGTDADNVHDCVAKGRATGGRTGGWKLTPEIHAEIRRRCTGRYGEYSALAREYGVTPETVRRVIVGDPRR